MSSESSANIIRRHFMKHFQSPKISAILAIATLTMVYGCDSDSSSSSENLTCPNDAPICGDICCPFECNDNICAFPNSNTNTQTEDDCNKNGQTFCNGKCVSIQSDPMHCGDCTTICSGQESCQEGKCVFGCGKGLTLLDNGLCVNTSSDSEHCGADNVACGESMYCNDGQCACMNKHYDCDGNADNGCESEVKCEYLCEEGKKTCGLNFCCAETESCCGSTCCEAGTTCCDGTTCIDLQSDRNHCGSCKEACGAREKCEAGVCVDDDSKCNTDGQISCWGSCIDVMSDAKNCGDCDHACDEGILCIEGKCQIECENDLQACGNECADFNTSPKHCGDCETQCANNQTCVDGSCTDNSDVSCENEEINKDLCWGTCVDMQTDPSHCGSCGVTCTKDQTCVTGACVDNPKPGECSVGQKMCFGVCRDILTDIDNCGECLNKCGENQACEAGKCEMICDETQIKCDGICFDPKTSTKHCGACDNACAAGMECREVEDEKSACQCDANHFDCDGDPANGCESTSECACTPGAEQACWRGAPENRGKGICKDGKQTCDDSGRFWGPCMEGVYPSSITCDDAGFYIGGDQNCNDIPDDQEDCKAKCDLMLSDMSYIGCEYWPVFLQNYSGFSEVYMDMTVVVSNPNDTDVDVYVFDKVKHDNASHQPYLSFTVPAGGVVTKLIVGDPTGSTDSNQAVPDSGQTIYDYMLQNTMLAPYAFKLRSSLPVVVYQFNPYGKSNGYTADASLLLPSNVLGQDYINLSYYSNNEDISANTFTVVAVKPGTTTIEVTPSIDVRSGTDVNNSSTIDAIEANAKRTFTLKQFDVLHLQQGDSGEMTGSRVHADKPIAVFGGAACTNIRSACDHTEEQLFPTNVWGTNYYAIRAGYDLANKKLLGDELDDYYILAQQDGTVVTITGNQGALKTDLIPLPAYSGGSGEKTLIPITTEKNFTGTVTLNSGQFTKITTTKNFQVSATKPILVAQFIDDVAKIGDPGYTLNVPVEQYRTDYSFSIPDNYEYDFVTLVAPKDTKIYYTGAGHKGTAYDNVLIDTLPSDVFSGWMTVGNDNYVYGYLDIDSGTHHLQGDNKFGALGYGFGDAKSEIYDDTSYAYPIGLNLDRINNTN